MNREQALSYVGHAIDDNGNVRSGEPIPTNARLVGWQTGFEPMFVAVWSYLPDVRLTDDEAEDLAIDYLTELGWFGSGHEADPDYPDYII